MVIYSYNPVFSARFEIPEDVRAIAALFLSYVLFNRSCSAADLHWCALHALL